MLESAPMKKQISIGLLLFSSFCTAEVDTPVDVYRLDVFDADDGFYKIFPRHQKELASKIQKLTNLKCSELEGPYFPEYGVEFLIDAISEYTFPNPEMEFRAFFKYYEKSLFYKIQTYNKGYAMHERHCVMDTPFKK